MSFDTEKYFDSLDMFGIRLGLDATRELMEKAGHPEKNLRFIHIAGTNGKGSTGAMLERCFRQAGFKTGFYTSPHLIDIRERFRINGQAVSREEFNRAGKKLSDCAKKGRYSYFEFATVLAMEIFAAAQTEVVIWETGMGGRLDATNAVMPQACVITNIALDHQGHLGNTLAEIAGEKAGILKAGVPLFHGVLPPEAETVILSRARESACPVYPPRATVPECSDFSKNCQNFIYDGQKFSLSLPGTMQRENFRIVYEIISYFAGKWQFSAAEAFKGLPEVRWPARFQHIGNTIIDGGHNPDGVRALVNAVKEYHPDEKFLIVYAAFGDKHAPECLKFLDTIAGEYIFTTPGTGGRAAFAPEQLTAMTAIPSTTEIKPDAAIKLAAKRPDTRVIISGSLYLAGTALQILCPPEAVLNI